MNIEVEKKFNKPSKKERKGLLKDARNDGVVLNHDIYYDLPGYQLLKDNIKLRKRSGSFELKIKIAPNTYQEIENEEEIKSFLKEKYQINGNLEDLNLVADFNYQREKYNKKGFNICFDKTDFDHELCEIEVMIGNIDDIKKTRLKIKEFAEKYELVKDNELRSKLMRYLEINKPEVFNEIRQNKKTEFNEPFLEIKKENSKEIEENKTIPPPNNFSFKMK